MTTALATGIAGVPAWGDPAVPEGGSGSALTADRAPVAYEPGPARYGRPSGAAPSGAAWSAGVQPAGAQSTGATTRAVRPVATAGAAGIGVREFSPVEARQISDRLQLMVNLANGNVVVRYTNAVVKGEDFATDVSHVYNNLSTGSGAFGRGWTMSTGRDVGLEVSSSTVRLYGPTGYRITFTRQSNGSWRGDSGANAVLTRSSNGEWSVKWNKSEDRWIFHSSGVLREMRTNNDVAVKFDYDAAKADRLTAIYDSLGRVTRFDDYDAQNRVLGFTDVVGMTHGPFRYDGDGNLTSFDDLLDHRISFRYDNGNLVGITGPEGDEYSLAYDAARRVTRVEEPTGGEPAVTTYAYPQAQRTTSTDPRGNTSTYHFDTLGKQTKAIDPLGHEQSKTWTANSDVASTTNGLGAVISYAFDANANPTSATMPTGARTAVGYADSAHPFFATAQIDPQGNELRGVYNAVGDLVSVRSVDQARDLVTYEHNDAGQVTKETDGEGRVTRYEYDQGGRLTVEIPPDPRGRMVMSYDDLDRVTATTDGKGTRLRYRHDAMDRVVEIGEVVDDVYRPLQYNEYDADGNLRGRYFDDTGVQFTHNPRNQVTEAHNTRGLTKYSVFYRYDPNNNLTDVFHDGGHLFYSYDKANRLIFQRGPGDRMAVSHTYDDDDRRTSSTFPNGTVTSMTYDKSGRQTVLHTRNRGGTTLVLRAYEWRDANDRDTMLLQGEGRGNGTAYRYSYDDLNQLTGRQSVQSVAYRYDRSGNVIGAEGRSFTMNGANQLTAQGGIGYTYDGTGSLTGGSHDGIRHTYSSTNQLLTSRSDSAGAIRLDYDSLDQSQRATITTEGPAGLPVERRLENTAIGITAITTGGLRSDFVRDSAGGLTGQVTATGESLYAVLDYQGSTIALIDDAGTVAASYDYTPYGTTAPSGRAAADNPFRWQGAHQLPGDVHGTYAMGYRQYNPYLARFTQPDPSRQEPNPYAFGLGNPVVNTDPSGLSPLSCGFELGFTFFGYIFLRKGLKGLNKSIVEGTPVRKSDVAAEAFGGASFVKGLGDAGRECGDPPKGPQV